MQIVKGNTNSNQEQSQTKPISDSSTSAGHTAASDDRLVQSYADRAEYSTSIYNRVQKGIFDKPSFLGHPDSLKGVTVAFDRKGNGTFIKDGLPLAALIVGELAPSTLGTKLDAAGTHYPWNSPVSYTNFETVDSN